MDRYGRWVSVGRLSARVAPGGARACLAARGEIRVWRGTQARTIEKKDALCRQFMGPADGGEQDNTTPSAAYGARSLVCPVTPTPGTERSHTDTRLLLPRVP